MKNTIILAIMSLVISLGSITNAQMKITGAGATFPYPIYSKWFDEYHNKTGIEFNYQSIGSGGGIKQVIEGTVDFGASDAPMKDEQIEQFKSKQGADILHIPTVMGAVVLTYNLPAAGKGLKLTLEVLSGIYLGEITKWDDSKITSINKGLKLPSQAIIVAHRSDGSGTSNIFTGYLTKVSGTWSSKVGQGVSVNWPVGLGGKGNEGVAGIVKQTVGAIGYVELAYAVQNNLPYASLKNKAGSFVEPTFESVSSAAAGFIKTMPADFRIELTNADGKNSYPICGFTWLLINKQLKDKSKAKAIVTFLKWAETTGQQYAKGLYYAPLPKEVVKLVEKKIDTIVYK